MALNLPVSRNTTYAPGSQVKSEDLNDLEDKIIDIWMGLTEVITPAALAGGSSTDDYAPTGLIPSTQVLLQDISGGGGGPTVTGLVAGTPGQTLWFVNIKTSIVQDITLTNEDALSDAINRFALPGSTDLDIPPNGAVFLFYDGAADRWRVLAKNF